MLHSDVTLAKNRHKVSCANWILLIFYKMKRKILWKSLPVVILLVFHSFLYICVQLVQWNTNRSKSPASETKFGNWNLLGFCLIITALKQIFLKTVVYINQTSKHGKPACEKKFGYRNLYSYFTNTLLTLERNAYMSKTNQRVALLSVSLVLLYLQFL